MEHKILSIVLLTLMSVMHNSSANVDRDVARVFWDGVGFFVPVSKQAVQKKLDQWYRTNSEVCEGPRLFLPNYRVFPELMDEDQHPVFIDWGNLTFHDFKDCRNEKSPVVYGTEVTVNIPLLTSDPNGPPIYSLALAKFYERSRGDFPKPNFLYPYFPVDNLTLDDFGASIQIRNEEMKVAFEKFRPPCKPPADVVVHEFDSFIKGDWHLGMPTPHFDYCQRNPTENRFCQTAGRLGCAVSRLSPNLCQKLYSLDSVQCATSVRIVRVTEYFREFMLFGDDDPITVISSETASGNFNIGLRYPCVD